VKAKVYEYQNCSTCKKALKFLKDRKVSFDSIPIVEHPPGKAELKRMLDLLSGELRKLFNTSGAAYRELGLGEKLESMSEKEALELLASNGKLVKRPFVLTDKAGLVGFKEDEWKKVFK
jgi:arsenate reductase (glutaredoxin)